MPQTRLNACLDCMQGEANELRKQLSLARSLRNGSSPEFDEKMTRLKQLREMRKGYLDKIQGEVQTGCGTGVIKCLPLHHGITVMALHHLLGPTAMLHW